VIAVPPLLAGAVQDTVLWVLAFEVAVTLVGAPGVVDGVATAEAADKEPVPEIFITATLKV
jgi:hypothetical protein